MTDPIYRFANEHRWSLENVQLAVEAKFRCQYCGKSFLDNAESYFSFTVDHLVPKEAGGGEEPNNKVLACRLCNVTLKGRWNPAAGVSGSITKEELLSIAREYIQRKRQEQESRVARERESANRLLEELSNGSET